MKIINSYPPNFSEIQSVLDPDETMIYCYGDTIYNPTGVEIMEDIMVHEAVHAEQQRSVVSPDVWWLKYLYDRDFRLSQEAEAYNAQWQFVKRHYPAKASLECLEELAMNLSKLYNCGVNVQQARTIIKKFKGSGVNKNVSRE